MSGTSIGANRVTNERRFGRVSRTRNTWTLRARLLLVLGLCLVGVCAVVGVATVSVYHGLMLNRLDATLEGAVDRGGLILQNQPILPAELPAAFLSIPGQPEGAIAVSVTATSRDAVSIDSKGRAQSLNDTVSKAFSNVSGVSPQTVDAGSLGDYRAMAVVISSTTRLVVALPLASLYTERGQLTAIIIVVSLAGLVLAMGAGSLVLQRAMSPLERITRTAQRVSEHPLDRGDVEMDERVPVTMPSTEVGRLGTAFNRMLDHVSQALSVREASERKVRTFVSDASHELRTPLASIRGYSELARLQGNTVPDEVRHAIGRIESEAVRMTGLVEDLLLLARLDEGREFTMAAVDVRGVVADMVGDAQVAGPDHDWSAVLPDTSAFVVCDESRLRQVVGNLLTNARVHTPLGTAVEARIDLTPERVCIVVSDAGPGIDPSVQESLFERFVRADVSRSRRAGSTGLGLAIVRAVTEAHGGIVRVARVNARTEFVVDLPRAAG